MVAGVNVVSKGSWGCDMTTTLAHPPQSSTVTGTPLIRYCALAIVGLLAALIAFQIALAVGAPLGRAAWGGDHTTLPTSLRIATIFPVAIYALGAAVVLRRAGYRVAHISKTVAGRGTWAFGAVLVLSALVNFASRSDWEQFLMAPIALVLALLTLAVARSKP